MNIFKRKEKHRPDTDDYGALSYGNPAGPTFTVSPPVDGAPGIDIDTRDRRDRGQDSRSRSRSRHRKGLRGFGGSGGGGGSGSGTGVGMPSFGATVSTLTATAASARLLARMPDAVLARIFMFVCPHSQDRSYETCEESSPTGCCMLCNTRDLAHCIRVCRRWRSRAEQILYTSIRLDTVHYCEREAILADKRKRRSFFERNAEPEDTPVVRLNLLCRAVRDDPARRLSRLVQLLKLPYMLRESRYADIARTISVLPNLRYVDLPEGLFMDEPMYIALKLEIQAKCPNLRKMTYMAGGERSFEALAASALWRNLEVLELVRMNIDPALVRHVLGTMKNLRALKVTEAEDGAHDFSNDVLASSPEAMAPIPACLNEATGHSDAGLDLGPAPLEELVLTNTTAFTTDGLLDYLRRPDTRETLQVLRLENTGIKPWSLQAVLAHAPKLRHLTIIEEITTSLPNAAGTRDIAPLASASLKTLNYEIKPSKAVSSYAGVTHSYYNYLSGSILSGGLPNLRTVYVRDADFPDSLAGQLLAPPGPIGGGEFGNRRPMSSSSGKGMQSSVPPVPPIPTSHMSPGVAVGAAANAPLAPPAKPWAAGQNPRFSSNNPFSGMISPQTLHTLEVFTKADDELDWNSIVVSGHDTTGSGGAASRPVSSYGLGAELGTVGARKSVFVSVGPGNFLALPGEGVSSGSSNGGGSYGHEFGASSNGYGNASNSAVQDLWPRPKSSYGEKKSEKMDLWR